MQMQPYAIRRHRELSLPVKCVLATIITTLGLYAVKNYIKPLWVGHHRRRNDDFANDYFEKHQINAKDTK